MNHIETYTGTRFEPLSPDPEQIHILDIAHALSNQCRFSGHTRVPYSVAEHSVRVHDLVKRWGGSKEECRWALLHDASEAYLVDVPAPLKAHPAFALYLAAEARLMGVICDRFDLSPAQPGIVHRADFEMLVAEARDLMPFQELSWGSPKPTAYALQARITPWSPAAAKAKFLIRFEEVMP